MIKWERSCSYLNESSLLDDENTDDDDDDDDYVEDGRLKNSPKIIEKHKKDGVRNYQKLSYKPYCWF